MCFDLFSNIQLRFKLLAALVRLLSWKYWGTYKFIFERLSLIGAATKRPKFISIWVHFESLKCPINWEQIWQREGQMHYLNSEPQFKAEK